VHAAVEAFVVGEDDDRCALRGQARPSCAARRTLEGPQESHAPLRPAQRGVRAREPLGAGVMIGLRRCEVLQEDEWRRRKLAHGGAPAAAMPHELAVEAFSHEFDA
jgi:hypothetical protein